MNTSPPLQLSTHESIRHWAKYTPDKIAIANCKKKTTYLELHGMMLKTRLVLKNHFSKRQQPIEPLFMILVAWRYMLPMVWYPLSGANTNPSS